MEKGKEQKHDQPKKYNLLLLGDSNVGKTSIFMKYTQNEFKGNYNSSIGIDFQIKNINYKDKNYSLQIYDTAGQERFRGITKSYYRLARGFLSYLI
jgi:small GTP-binding protein